MGTEEHMGFGVKHHREEIGVLHFINGVENYHILINDFAVMNRNCMGFKEQTNQYTYM